MPLSAWTQLGRSEILAPVGAGSMVKRIERDTKVNRAATRVSATHFSEFFQREADVLASLSHVNICQLLPLGSELSGDGSVEGPPVTASGKRRNRD